MELDNLLEVVMHHLLIGEITYLDHQDGLPMVTLLMSMVTQWIKTMVSHDISYRVVMTSPNYSIT